VERPSTGAHGAATAGGLEPWPGAEAAGGKLYVPDGVQKKSGRVGAKAGRRQTAGPGRFEEKVAAFSATLRQGLRERLSASIVAAGKPLPQDALKLRWNVAPGMEFKIACTGTI